MKKPFCECLFFEHLCLPFILFYLGQRKSRTWGNLSIPMNQVNKCI
uniref:Uncharacterized protein n=1 Tax=Rhizophora mucronata TaxID=61149 RepID=A0A2P2PXL6_RHIMU